jgi:hypothetical protein
LATQDKKKFAPEIANCFRLGELSEILSEMEMDIDKSEDELELERLVFGDSEGITERLKGKTDAQKPIQTDLEHLEDDQVY